MPKLRLLSGEEVVRILGEFDFVIASQRGSHVKLRRNGIDGEKQTLIVPRHKELDRGTLAGIHKQASRYIPETDLRDKFYA